MLVTGQPNLRRITSQQPTNVPTQLKHTYKQHKNMQTYIWHCETLASCTASAADCWGSKSLPGWPIRRNLIAKKNSQRMWRHEQTIVTYTQWRDQDTYTVPRPRHRIKITLFTWSENRYWKSGMVGLKDVIQLMVKRQLIELFDYGLSRLLNNATANH